MKTIKIKIAKSWNELSDNQLEQLALLFNSGKAGVLFDVAIFEILFSGSKRDLQIVLNDTSISELKTHYTFIYTEANRTAFVKQWKLAGKILHSPADRFINLTIEEYAMAEDLHHKWHKSKERAYLEYMAAVLYVPARGKRPEFEKLLLDDKAKLFNQVPMQKLLAMELAFAGSKNNLAKRFPKVYPAAKETKTQGKKENYGFAKVILQMAGGKFGDHEKTGRTNVFTFHEQLQENIKEV